MRRIIRNQYFHRLIGLMNTPDIKIITGVRRSGKSVLMREYIDYIKSNFKNVNIIFIDFVDIEFDEIKEYKKLHHYVESKYIEGKNNYLFIDEIQLCTNFEITINSLHAKMKYDIYLTGSNAFLMGNDLATLFTGRYIDIHIFPFSYLEYCDYFELKKSSDEAFDKYILDGGFSGSYSYLNVLDRRNYLKNVYETIVLRDIVQKYNIKDIQILKQLTEFLMDNISNLTSPNKVADLLKSSDCLTNHNTIGKYIKYLCNTFIFYDTKRYDVRGKKYLETSNKFYLVDSGLRYAILGERNMDFGRIYENVVCIELKRRGYDVYVGKLYQKEIDFVATKMDEKIYIQVSDDISNADTFKREYFPLLQIKDAYPKIIIARTKHPRYTYEGIEIFDIKDWLSI